MEIPNALHTMLCHLKLCKIQFICTFAEENALVLPGRVPGYSLSDIQLLPSSLSKSNIWNQYSSSTEKCVAYSTFVEIFHTINTDHEVHD